MQVTVTKILALLALGAPAFAAKTLVADTVSLSFSDQPVGTQSASQTVTFTNTGDETVTVAPPSNQGGNGALEFPGTQNCSQLPLAPGAW